MNAAGNSRSNNIKSHGVFVGKNAEADQEVVLDSFDLLYLAGECDKLETMIHSLSLQEDASIEYKYHTHIGDENHEGGCYTDGYHVHEGCHYTQHSHGSSCYTDDKSRGVWYHGYSCQGVDGHCPGHYYSKLTCTQSTSKIYSCGSPINRWRLACGRREGEVEEAHIVFAPSGG